MTRIKILISGIIIASVLTLGGCTSFQSSVKNWESNSKGLERTVYVYSITGELLKTYEGKSVRIESENSESNAVSILIDGKKHKFNNALVITEEK